MSEDAASGAFVARLPQGIANREQLFDSLQQALILPGYFGRNWDALSDCLRDFHWVEERRIILVHDDLPPMPETVLSTYLGVLADAARDWEPEEDHELRVVFPEASVPRSRLVLCYEA